MNVSHRAKGVPRRPVSDPEQVLPAPNHVFRAILPENSLFFIFRSEAVEGCGRGKDFCMGWGARETVCP